MGARRLGAATAILVLLVIAAAPTGSSTHDDGTYDQPITLQWDSAELDIVVLPPSRGQIGCAPSSIPPPDPAGYAACSVASVEPGELDPMENTYRRALEEAFAAWEHSMEVFGPGWLQDGVSLTYHWPGQPAGQGVRDPEIVFAFTDATGATATRCNAESPYCEGLEGACVAQIGSLGGTLNASHVRNLAAHELGHCLGLDHTGTGGQGEGIHHPASDVMSYGGKPHPIACVSNLNVRGLTLAFAPALDRSVEAAWRVNGTARVAVDAYEQVDCNDVTSGPTWRPGQSDAGNTSVSPTTKEPGVERSTPGLPVAVGLACLIVAGRAGPRR